MWLWDGNQHRPLRKEANRPKRERLGLPRNVGSRWRGDHLPWEVLRGAGLLGRVAPDGSSPTEIAMPSTGLRYGHFTTGAPGKLVTDGCYEEPRDPRNWGGSWISLVEADWEAGELRWTPLCLNGSSWTSQDCHPHPVFDRDNRYIYFTSDQGGPRRIYRVEVASP